MVYLPNEMLNIFFSFVPRPHILNVFIFIVKGSLS
jgi:hypothetical protein